MTALGVRLFVLAAALLLDRIVGDPQWIWRRLPHPVVLTGSSIGWLERQLNDSRHSFRQRRNRGVAALVLLVAGLGAIGLAVHRVLASMPFGLALEALLVAVLLAQKSLIDHVSAVARALDLEGVAGARARVAEIVGRDVSTADAPGISRAAIESAAENFSDGVVAPAFWFALLGLPGLLVYKGVNTADSMLGHRNARYEAFGCAAARMDDLLNLLPARLSALLIAIAALLTGRSAGGALKALRDAPKHKSPNAGWPEAAIAGALGLALGGPRSYAGAAVDGAWLNEGGRKDATAADIKAAVRLIDLAWAVLTAMIVLAALGVR